MSISNGPAETPHKKARTSPYPGSKVGRSQVPNEKVSWLVEWPEYKAVEYASGSVLAGPRWADPLLGERNFSLKFNEKDGHVERRSQNEDETLISEDPTNANSWHEEVSIKEMYLRKWNALKRPKSRQIFRLWNSKHVKTRLKVPTKVFVEHLLRRNDEIFKEEENSPGDVV
eukprot:bmy_13205T0